MSRSKQSLAVLATINSKQTGENTQKHKINNKTNKPYK